MTSQVMNLLDHGGRIRIIILIELHGVPTVLAPPLPVLDDSTHGDSLVMEPLGGGQELLLGSETFPAMDVLEYPVRHRRDMAGKRAVRLHDVIRASGEDSIVQTLGNRRGENRLVSNLPPIKHRSIPIRGEDINLMFPGGQLGHYSGGRRQPAIRGIDQRLPVYGQILLPGHGSSHIQKEAVLGILRQVNLSYV